MSRLLALTGPRGAGKTTLCQALAGRARAAGWTVAGLLSPAVITDGVRTGILAEDLATGETRTLAQVAPVRPDGAVNAGQLHFRRWLFDRAALEWGNDVLAATAPCDLLIVDEIGPLELQQGSGWVNGLTRLRRLNYRLGVFVIRPELLAEALSALPPAEVIDLAVTPTPEERTRIIERLVPLPG